MPSRFVTINNVRYAGSISISIVSVGELPFFEIDIPFYDGFTPIPEKTVSTVGMETAPMVQGLGFSVHVEFAGFA